MRTTDFMQIRDNLYAQRGFSVSDLDKFLFKTRMITFIKTKFNDQTNIEKYRVHANITEYHKISKLLFRRIIIKKFRICFMYKKLPIIFSIRMTTKNHYVCSSILLMKNTKQQDSKNPKQKKISQIMNDIKATWTKIATFRSKNCKISA